MRVCTPEEDDSRRRGNGSRNGGGGLLERGRLVLEGNFWQELSPTHGDLQVLHLCSVLCSLPGNATHRGRAQAANAVFLHALVGEANLVSPWRSPPGH